MDRYKLALLLAFIPCIIPRLVHLAPRIHMNDFEVYYSAAVLARQHQGAAIYAGADSGKDAQLEWADPSTPIALTAKQAGVDKVRLYVYPPILADLLIPLSLAPLAAAKVVWTIINISSILLIVFMLTRMMGLSTIGPGALLLLLGLVFSSPVYSCVFWGQVTLLLTLCWMFGMYGYMKGWRAASAIVLALATAIKLTPILVLFPILVWKDWKWLRAFTVSLLAFFIVMSAISTPYALTDYFLHVVPSMSRGIPEFANHTLAAAIQYLYVALHGVSIFPMTFPIPDGVVKVGKAISLTALLLIVIMPLYRCRKNLSLRDRIIALALIAMVSPAIAPVSWIHAYAVCYPAIALLWGEAFVRRISTSKLILLTTCSIVLNSIAMTDVIEGLVHSGSHRVLASLMMFVTPLAALALASSRFYEMRLDPIYGGDAVPQPGLIGLRM